MKLKFANLFTIVIITVFTTSCGLLYRTILGIDSTPSWKSLKQIQKDSKKFKIPESHSYILDTASYYSAVIDIYNNRKEELKKDSSQMDSLDWFRAKANVNNDLQPVQIRYFDQDGKPLFKMINCYIDGYISMSWNVDSCFETFPPQTIDGLSYDTNENLAFFIPHLTTLNEEKVQISDIPKADYYAIVFWNSFMIKPSRTLIKQLKEYEENNPDKNTYFLYVNNHNSQIWNMLTKEQKQEGKVELEKERIKNEK
jgi:hypothetical protein